MDVAKEVDDMFGPDQQRQMPQDDNPVEAVIYKSQRAAKQLCGGFHRFSPTALALTTRSSFRGPVEIKISNIFG
jgi:hypothetical protein